ncbi:hypothetical protein ACXWRS_12145, partial [Streptococcus pyogenes]
LALLATIPPSFPPPLPLLFLLPPFLSSFFSFSFPLFLLSSSFLSSLFPSSFLFPLSFPLSPFPFPLFPLPPSSSPLSL